MDFDNLRYNLSVVFKDVKLYSVEHGEIKFINCNLRSDKNEIRIVFDCIRNPEHYIEIHVNNYKDNTIKEVFTELQKYFVKIGIEIVKSIDDLPEMYKLLYL